MKKILVTLALSLAFSCSMVTVANSHLIALSKRADRLPRLSYQHFHDAMNALDAMGTFSALAALNFIVDVYLEPNRLTPLDTFRDVRQVSLTRLQVEELFRKGQAILEKHERTLPLHPAEKVFQEISAAIVAGHSQGYSPEWLYATHLLARTGMGAYRLSVASLVEREFINSLRQWGSFFSRSNKLDSFAVKRQWQIGVLIAEVYLRQRELISPSMTYWLDRQLEDVLQTTGDHARKIFHEAQQSFATQVQMQKEREQNLVGSDIQSGLRFLIQYSYVPLEKVTRERLFALQTRADLPEEIRIGAAVRLLTREARNRVLDQLEVTNMSWRSVGALDCIRAILLEGGKN